MDVHKRMPQYERYLHFSASDQTIVKEAKRLIGMMICTFAFGRKPWFALHEGDNGSVYYVTGRGRKRYVTDYIEELM